MKRLFTVLALVSMINMAALAVLATLAWHRRYLEPERIRKVLALLTADEAQPTTLPAQASEAPPASSGERIERNQEVEEIVRTELDRRKREIENGWKLLERQQIAFVQAQEAFEAERTRQREAAEARAKAEADSGYVKELDIISGLKAKEAKDLLRLKEDAAVVTMLMSMEPRTARKIVGACKKDDERLWIGRILAKMHERDAAQAEVLDAGE